MASSRRMRHRDRAPGRREVEDTLQPNPNRVFRLTGQEREHLADCLREIDEARRALEARQSADNRELIRQLRTAADEIFEVLEGLVELDDDGGVKEEKPDR